MNKYGQPAQLALRIHFTFHSSARWFGEIMSLTKPWHTVAYYFFNEGDTRFPIFAGIRETYDGPLSMAADNMMWNIKRDKTRSTSSGATIRRASRRSDPHDASAVLRRCDDAPTSRAAAGARR